MCLFIKTPSGRYVNLAAVVDAHATDTGCALYAVGGGRAVFEGADAVAVLTALDAAAGAAAPAAEVQRGVVGRNAELFRRLAGGPPTLYEITTGATGESYVRAYAWAPPGVDPVALFRAVAPGAKPGPGVVTVRALFSGDAAPFCTAPTDHGWPEPADPPEPAAAPYDPAPPGPVGDPEGFPGTDEGSHYMSGRAIR